MGRYKNEELKECFKLFFKPYLNAYRERVNTLYTDENNERSSFQYMEPIQLHVLLRDNDTHLIFSSGNEDNISFVECNSIESEVFEQISSSSSKVKDNFIKSITRLDKYHNLLHYPQLGENAGFLFNKQNQDTLLKQTKVWGVKEADFHFSRYEFEKALEKAIAPDTGLTIVNTVDILEKVKDPSFQYEFGESAKAYNAGLYLAAGATAGIALENILRLIIRRKMGEKKLPDKSFIWLSIKTLEKEQIVPGRLLGEVSRFESVRNSNAHTNEDPVRKETVEAIYLLLNDLIPFTL